MRALSGFEDMFFTPHCFHKIQKFHLIQGLWALLSGALLIAETVELLVDGEKCGMAFIELLTLNLSISEAAFSRPKSQVPVLKQMPRLL